MKTVIVILQVSVLVISLASCATRQSGSRPDSAADKSSEGIANAAKLFIERLSKGEFSEAGKDFDSNMKQLAPPEKLREAWTGISMQMGPLKRQVKVTEQESSPYRFVFVTCEFERATVTMRVVFNGQGQISGYFMEPPA